MELRAEVCTEEINSGVISNRWYSNQIPPQQEHKWRLVLSLGGRESQANEVGVEHPREARERRSQELRGRCFRKEGLVGVSHTAEVSCQVKVERVLCPLGLAATLTSHLLRGGDGSQTEVGLDINGR